MRFLHTADWHLGKGLRGRSRTDEQEAVLAEILEIAKDQEVDCVLVCGDIFDSHVPTPEAERLAYSFLAELIGQKIPAVVIGGNHDHPRRLAAVGELVEQLGVFVRPEPVRADQGGIVTLEAGGERAQIAVLPFVTERKIVDAADLIGPEDASYADYADRVAGMLEQLTAGFGTDTVNLILGHLFMRGAETSGSERAIHIGQPYEVSGQRLPPTAAYVALGHLHRPQQLDTPSPAVYAGSALQLDFGEAGQDKRVVVVEAAAGKPARVDSILLTAGRRLRQVQGTMSEIEEVSEEAGDDFLRVTVLVEEPVPGIADQVRDLLPNAVDVHIDYPKEEVEERGLDLGALSPEALFAEFFRATYQTEVPDELGDLFRELWAEVADAPD